MPNSSSTGSQSLRTLLRASCGRLSIRRFNTPVVMELGVTTRRHILFRMTRNNTSFSTPVIRDNDVKHVPIGYPLLKATHWNGRHSASGRGHDRWGIADDHFDATILLAAALGVIVRNGLVLALAGRNDAIGTDAFLHQE